MAGLPPAMRAKKAKLEAEAAAAAQAAEKPQLEVVQTSSPEPMPEPAPVVSQNDSSPVDESQFYVSSQDSSPIEQPRVEAQATTSSEPNWKEEAERYKTRWETAQGMYRRLEDDNLAWKEKFSQLESSIQELRNRPEPKAPIVVEPEEGFSAKELEEYQHAFPVVEKLIKNKTRDLAKTAAELREELAQLKEAHTGVSKNLMSATEQSFINMVKNSVGDKDFREITNGNLKPQWVEYLSQRVPYTDFTLGQVLDTAHKGSNFDRVVEIFNNFKSTVKPPESQINKMMAPSFGSVGSREVKEKPKLKFSGLKEAYDKHRRGQIKTAEVNKIKALYDQAARENRIDHSA